MTPKYDKTYELNKNDYPRKRVEFSDIDEQLKEIIKRLNDIEDRLGLIENKIWRDDDD